MSLSSGRRLLVIAIVLVVLIMIAYLATQPPQGIRPGMHLSEIQTHEEGALITNPEDASFRRTLVEYADKLTTTNPEERLAILLDWDLDAGVFYNERGVITRSVIPRRH
jgi:hypothetical protein